MKIIHIIPAYKPAFIYGGPTMSVAKLCEGLIEADIEVEVYTTTANGPHELDVEPGKTRIVDQVPVTYFKRLTKDHTHFSPALLLALRKRINGHGGQNTDLIIHIHSWWNLVSIFACWLAKFYNIPVVLSPRGMLTQYTTVNRNAGVKSIIHQLLGKTLLAYCHIHATSEKEKQDILQLISPKSITVIPNLVKLSASGERKTDNAQGTFKLLFLSRIEEKKGLELLFEALAMIDIDWQLTIAGSGENGYVEGLKTLVSHLRLQSNISWIGHVGNEDKFKLMAAYDLLVLTSYNENFANVIIESLSVGTPVLVSDKVGLADYVEMNNLGWITSLDIGIIANKIQEAYLDREKRSQIRNTATAIIDMDFNTKKLISRYHNLYNSIFNYPV